MRLNFLTSNLDEKLYKRAIECTLYETLKKVDSRWAKILDNLDIHMYSSEKSHEDKFFFGVNGVGGITGINTITMYLNDTKSNPKDPIQMALRVNMLAISHELCHHILLSMGKTHRVQLRNNDYSGHKKGDTLNFSTAEVHDRHMEKKFITLSFWHYIKGIIPYKYKITIVDITDII